MRYILFGKDEKFFACGGAHDYLGAEDDLDRLSDSAEIKKLKDSADEFNDYWWHIFDTKEKRIVAGTSCQAYEAPYLYLSDSIKARGATKQAKESI